MKTNVPNTKKLLTMMEDCANHNPAQFNQMLVTAQRSNPSIVIERNGRSMGTDIFSYMLQSRTIFYTGGVDEISAELAISQLLYLEHENPELDISMNIASPGGAVYYGDGVIDTMNLICPDVKTIGHGLQMSMGAQTLISGAKNKRFAMLSSRIMIHQPSGGSQGTATSMSNSTKEINYLKAKLLKEISNRVGISFEHVVYLCEGDYYMTARKALEYGEFGLIDGIIVGHEEITPLSDEDKKANKKCIPPAIILKRGDARLDEYCPDLSAESKIIEQYTDTNFKLELAQRVKIEIEAMHAKNGTEA